jgi:glycosyltransferase involved in cell wall biosynthesis
MLDALNARSTVDVFDRAPRGAKRASYVLNHLRESCRFLVTSLTHPQANLYLALSGGFGQFYDSLYVLICKLQRRRMFIHHHSFAYVNEPTRLSRLFFSLVRHQTHIVLSRNMGAALIEVYGLDPDKVKVLSNAAFFSAPGRAVPLNHRGATPIRLGFISNITIEKGFVEFFGVLSELTRLGVPYRAVIAGPVDPSVQRQFSELLARTDNTTAAGPLYGDAKDRFFQQLDILLFPTKYANEAEPLVIHEALRHGVPVIACDRGAIAEILQNGAGSAFPADGFTDGAVARIRAFVADPDALARAQRASLEESQRISRQADSTLADLLTEIAGRPT